jgi:hypothetical protein
VVRRARAFRGEGGVQAQLLLPTVQHTQRYCASAHRVEMGTFRSDGGVTA